MVTLERNQLVFSFPDIHEEASLHVEFQRTLRIPDDNRSYPLPPGLGAFPLTRIDDCLGALPESWKPHGGVLLPIWQAEAMWIRFVSPSGYPFAVKVAAGKINAVTGESWTQALSASPQDYVVVPDQPWLDGFCIAKGMVRQFVAMPLGQGYSAEEQLTGSAEHGGLQLIMYPMKPDVYRANCRPKSCGGELYCIDSMGLAPGGLMRQEIFEDRFGLDAWVTATSSRCFVHLLNSEAYAAVCGQTPPTRPPTAFDYTSAGLPWFEYYADNLNALPGSKKLAGMDGIAAAGIKKGEEPLPDNSPVTPKHIEKLVAQTSAVREGHF